GRARAGRPLRCARVRRGRGPQLRVWWAWFSSGWDWSWVRSRELDCLDFAELLQAEAAQFTSVAGLAVAAEGRGGVEPAAVDGDLTGPHPAGHGEGPVGVGRPDRAGEAVVGGVGQFHCVVDVAVAEHGEHGSEDFFARGCGVAVQSRQYGGGHEVSLFGHVGVGSTGGEDRAVLAGLLQVPQDAAVGVGRGQRPDTGGRVSGVAHGFAAGRVHGEGDRFLVAVVRHEQAGQGGAGLAGVEQAVGDDGVRRGRQVGVVEDNSGGFAAELQGDLLDGGGGHFGDAASGTGGAGEGDHVHVRVGRQCFADYGAGAGDEVEHAGWEADRVDDLGEEERRERGDLAGFEDDGAARGEGGGDLRDDLVQRIVPRGDGADDADGFAEDEGVAD